MSSWQCGSMKYIYRIIFFLTFIQIALASQKIPISCSITNDRGTKFFDHGAIAIPELTFESNKQEFDLQDFEGSSVLRCGYRNKISGHWSAGTSFYKLGDLLESHHAYKDCFFLHTSKNADLESLDDIIQVVHSFKPVSKGSNEETKPDIVLIYPESPEPLLSFPKRKPQNPASTAGSRNKHTLPKDSRTKDKSSEGNDDTGDTEALPEEKTFLQRFGLYLIPILFLLFVGTSGGSQASGSSNR